MSKKKRNFFRCCGILVVLFLLPYLVYFVGKLLGDRALGGGYFYDWKKDEVYFKPSTSIYSSISPEVVASCNLSCQRKDLWCIPFPDKIVLPEANGVQFRTKGLYGFDDTFVYFVGKKLPLLKGKTFSVVTTGEPINVPNIEYIDNICEKLPFLNWLLLPYVGGYCSGDSFLEYGYVISQTAKDDSYVYRNCDLTSGGDGASFEPIPSRVGYFSKDKQFVYLNSKPLIGADPQTFVLLTKQSYPNASIFSKDKKYVYKNDKKIEGADAGSFHILLEEIRANFQVDKSFFYQDGNRVAAIDGETFVPLNNYFFKDKTAVYEFIPTKNLLSVIDGVDPQTFTHITGGYYKDKYFVYFWDYRLRDIVKDADPTTFTVLSEGKIYDKYHEFYWKDGKLVSR